MCNVVIVLLILHSSRHGKLPSCNLQVLRLDLPPHLKFLSLLWANLRIFLSCRDMNGLEPWPCWALCWCWLLRLRYGEVAGARLQVRLPRPWWPTTGQPTRLPLLKNRLARKILRANVPGGRRRQTAGAKPSRRKKTRARKSGQSLSQPRHPVGRWSLSPSFRSIMADGILYMSGLWLATPRKPGQFCCFFIA